MHAAQHQRLIVDDVLHDVPWHYYSSYRRCSNLDTRLRAGMLTVTAQDFFNKPPVREYWLTNANSTAPATKLLIPKVSYRSWDGKCLACCP